MSESDMKKSVIGTIKIVHDPNEHCWQTGEYTGDCDCEACYHKSECSGYDRKDDD
jgi:hypothetical protein